MGTALRKMSVPKRGEVTRERRGYIRRGFVISIHQIIFRFNKSRRMSWAGNVARLGERKGAYRVLVGKPQAKRPLGRPRHRWDNNIKMNLYDVGRGHGLDWCGSGVGQLCGLL
jgi:hypothetical protein